ncbi:MAG TPA: MFS transporter, partial [Bryobacteraceae bacterium]
IAKTGPGSDTVAAFLAGAMGWTLDAFDFFLVVFCLTAIGREFHKADATVSLSIVMTLAFRPLGGFIFGLLADRYGRRVPMIWNLALCGFVQLLSGLAPTFAIFLASRALFGIFMGGQWGVAASLAMEKVPVRLRGLLSGVLQQGYAAGYLLAALVYSHMIGRYGWRSLFFVACIPALLSAVFMFARVRESQVWEENRHADWGSLGRALLANWKLLLYITLFATALQLSSHGSQDMYPTFLERQWGFTASQRALVTACSMVGAIIGGILCGHLSDRWGRRRTMMLALGGAVLLIPLWAFAPSIGLLVTGAFLIQFLIQGAWGVVPAYLTELSPTSVRGFLPGFGNGLGVVLASSVVYLEAVFARISSYSVAMASTAATVLIAAVIIIGLGTEKLAGNLGSEAK